MKRYMKRYIIALFIALWPPALALAQRPFPNDKIAVFDNPTVTITTGTADSTSTPTAGMHQALIQFTFGTVTGSYTSCTVQAKATLDGTNYATLGSAQTIVVSNGQVNQWVLTEPAGTAPGTAAQGFGQEVKFTFSCGGYGTSAPVTISALYTISLSGGVPGPLGGSGSFSVYTTGGDNLVASQVSVTNSATQIVAARTARRGVSVTQIAPTVAAYCGPTSGVTTSTGDYLPAVDGASLSYPTNSAIYCITPSSSTTVGVAEVY